MRGNSIVCLLLAVIAGCDLALDLERPPVRGACVPGHDEDDDGRDDCSDPCPHLSSATDPAVDADLDEDGVGDGCDPEVDDPGESILWFDAFDADRGLYDDFRGAIEGGAADFGDQAGFFLATTPEKFRITSAFWVMNLTGTDFHEMGFAYAATPTPTVWDGDYCLVGTDVLGDFIGFHRFEGNDPIYGPRGAVTFDQFDDLGGTLTIDVLASSVACKVTEGSVLVGSVTTSRVDAQGGAAFLARRAHVRMYYVLVIAVE